MKNTRFSYSVLIVNYNTYELTLKCIFEIIKIFKDIEFEIIVYDNNSVDGSYNKLENSFKDNKDVRIIMGIENIGFGPANNQLALLAKNDILLLLNSDAFPIDVNLFIVNNLFINNKEILACGPLLRNVDNSIQLSARSSDSILYKLFSYIGFLNLFKNIFTIMYPSLGRNYYLEDKFTKSIIGAVVFIRRLDFLKHRGFDENFFFTGEESDLFKRLRKNGKIKLISNIEFLHIMGASSNYKSIVYFYISQIKYFKKWYGRVPAYFIYFIFLIKSLLLCFSGKDEIFKFYIKLSKEIFNQINKKYEFKSSIEQIL